MKFTETLQQLPTIQHLAELHLFNAAGEMVGQIENKPGKTGSLTVYAALAAKHGGIITPAAAEEGLKLFAEHTADAQANPGKHPNIDRLLELIQHQTSLTVKLIEKLS